MREKWIEQQLVKAVKDIGGIALKIVSPGFDGMPDRLILLPNRKAAFVEVKALGKSLRPLQEKRKRQLEALGFCKNRHPSPICTQFEHHFHALKPHLL